MAEWIPVTERLPLYGQDVLAVRPYWDGEKCQEVLMAHIAVWNEETGEKWWNATNITHWMPLPEPPTPVMEYPQVEGITPTVITPDEHSPVYESIKRGLEQAINGETREEETE